MIAAVNIHTVITLIIVIIKSGLYGGWRLLDLSFMASLAYSIKIKKKYIYIHVSVLSNKKKDRAKWFRTVEDLQARRIHPSVHSRYLRRILIGISDHR